MRNHVKGLLSSYGKRLFDLFVLIAALSSIVAILVPSPSIARVIVLVASLVSISVAFTIHRLIINRVQIEYHRIDYIQSCDKDYPERIEMTNRRLATITSSKEHVKVKVVGKFYGPELRTLAKKYSLANLNGDTTQDNRKKPLKVCAVVSEMRRRIESDFVYVQANEGDLLREDGSYTVYAYLGGREIDKAEHGDVFSIRIFTTDGSLNDLGSFPLPNIGKLTGAIYISDEYLVVIERPAGLMRTTN